MTSDQLQKLLKAPEGERLEFKTAARTFEFDELAKYCVALANEGGGRVIFGVTDARPRTVVGTLAFGEPGRTEAGLFDRLGHRVAMEELQANGKRVLVATIPGRLPGMAWNDRGAYWMRAGDALIPMPDERLREIHAETASDFSGELTQGVTLQDLDPEAIAEFRKRWSKREQNERIAARSDMQVLRDAELLRDDLPTNAALMLFGKPDRLTWLLPQAELVFEYRSTESAGPAQERLDFRKGLLLYLDELWAKINARNDRQSYQDGLFRAEIATFDEQVVREAILNAVCHRDYRHHGSVFVRQYTRRLEVLSPGGFPEGINLGNILDEQYPRNRRLAESLARCGLIERAGQGVNVMFERSVRQSKPLPDYSSSTQREVRLVLKGTVANPDFLRFLERMGEERLAAMGTQDLLVLDSLQRGETLRPELKPRLPGLIEAGVVESTGRGQHARYLLSRRFYTAIGRPGAYTRRKGLDREENKALLRKHLFSQKAKGCPISELEDVLTGQSRAQVGRLLAELRSEGRIELRGEKRWARWYFLT